MQTNLARSARHGRRFASSLAQEASEKPNTAAAAAAAAAPSKPIRIEVHVKDKTASSPSATSKMTLGEMNKYLAHHAGSPNHIKSFADLPLEFGYNQHISIDNDMRERLRALLWKFNAPVQYAFAYGSGVFSQGKASDANKPQIDLILGVSYSQHWHSLNMRQHPEHYSSLRWLGSGAVAFVQDKIGAGLYFNPYVEMDGLKIKYGVVNMDTMLGDVGNWNTLYLAGRLHKPVKILRDEPRMRFVNQANLFNALRTALLLLPEDFSELDLYKTVAGISYLGDPRMTVGENPNKVNNIVNNQFLNFRNLYSSLLDMLPNVEMAAAEGTTARLAGKDVPIAHVRQNMDPVTRGKMVHRLPANFRAKLYAGYQSKYATAESLDQSIATDAGLAQAVSAAIRSTVAWPSLTQSLKGVATAGVGRSVKYAAEKLRKSRQ